MRTFGKWILFLIALGILTQPFVLFTWFPEFASQYSASFSYWLPFCALALVSAVVGSFYYRTSSAGEIATQLFVLVITVASFYAFGWPKHIESGHMREAFAELAVILILFLLAELAAHLTTEAKSIGNLIKTSAGKAVEDISKTTGEVVTNIKAQGESIAKNLSDLTSKIDPAKLERAVDELEQISHVLASIKEIADPNAKQRVLEKMSDYTRAWSGVLQPLADRDPVSEAKRSCILSFFNTYVNEEIGDLGWDEGSKTLKKKHIAMATNDSLYLKILNGVLESLEKSDLKSCFAWAITNVRPEDFYHWGERYGHVGAHPVMDDFRKTVGKIVANGHWKYQRLFLIANTTLRAAPYRIELEPPDRILEQKNRVLLLSTTEPDDTGPSDVARPIEVWQQVIGDWYMSDQPGTTNAYGILNLNQLQSLEAAKAAAGEWELNKSYKVLCRDGLNRIEFTIRPTLLLDYFEKTYQSEGGMFGLAVSDSDRSIWDNMPGKNGDWLIVGTRERGTGPIPVVAISANLSPTSNTMLMELYTDNDDLVAIGQVWHHVRKVTFRTVIQRIEEDSGQGSKSHEA